MAAKTLARSLAGASVPMWIDYMYARLGNEWAGSLLAFISLAMACSESPRLPPSSGDARSPAHGLVAVPFLFWFKGKSIRERSKLASN